MNESPPPGADRDAPDLKELSRAELRALAEAIDRELEARALEHNLRSALIRHSRRPG